MMASTYMDCSWKEHDGTGKGNIEKSMSTDDPCMHPFDHPSIRSRPLIPAVQKSSFVVDITASVCIDIYLSCLFVLSYRN